jgi:hypothetical protein
MPNALNSLDVIEYAAFLNYIRNNKNEKITIKIPKDSNVLINNKLIKTTKENPGILIPSRDVCFSVQNKKCMYTYGDMLEILILSKNNRTFTIPKMSMDTTSQINSTNLAESSKVDEPCKVQ